MTVASQTALLPPPSHPKASSFWRRKRTYMVAGILAVLIVVAVVVPVKVVQSRRGPGISEEELFFPAGSLNGPLGNGGRRVNVSQYDQLLVFGSSYSDNGHSREARWAGTIPDNGYAGVWSNGPVWVTYLQRLLGGDRVTHLNYAYGGATIQRVLNPSGPPTTGEQIQTYLSQLATNASADASLYSRKSLVPTFTTTNDINSVWRNFLDPSNADYANLTTARSVIRRSASEFIEELRALIPRTGANASSSAYDRMQRAPDFLILPILPVELTPQSRQLARDANMTVEGVAEITKAYNTALVQGARSLASTLGSRGNVFTHDVPSWFYRMNSSLSEYGISRIDAGCSQVGCSNPRRYVWWDHLHLVTSMQERLARNCARVVLGTNSTA